MPKPKEEKKKERRNTPRADGYKVLSDEERADRKKKAKQLAELLEYNREEKKDEPEPKKNWLDSIFDVEETEVKA